MDKKLYDNVASSEKNDGKRKAEMGDIRTAIKEQVDEVGRALYFDKSQRSSELKTISSLNFPLVSMSEGRITSVTSC